MWYFYKSAASERCSFLPLCTNLVFSHSHYRLFSSCWQLAPAFNELQHMTLIIIFSPPAEKNTPHEHYLCGIDNAIHTQGFSFYPRWNSWQSMLGDIRKMELLIGANKKHKPKTETSMHIYFFYSFVTHSDIRRINSSFPCFCCVISFEQRKIFRLLLPLLKNTAQQNSLPFCSFVRWTTRN